MAKTRRQKNHKEPYTGEDGQSTPNDRKGKGLTKQDHDITNRTETPMVTIDMDDIEDEITYWSSAMICFVLGANPPLPVMSGFCNRIWGKKGLDKVSMVGRGLFLVRFNTLEQCHKALTGDPQFFDYKPLIMKQWSPDIELHKENVKTVPIWIRMPNLDLKYWGQGCLHKLGDIIGTTLKVDNVTMNKDRLSYARILVEVELDKELLIISDSRMRKDYLCNKTLNMNGDPHFTVCKKYGHPSDKCHKQTKKQWQPKLAQDQQQLKVGPSFTKTADTEQKAEEKGQKDSQGFLPAKGKGLNLQTRLLQSPLYTTLLRLSPVTQKRMKMRLTTWQQENNLIYGFNGKIEREPLWEDSGKAQRAQRQAEGAICRRHPSSVKAAKEYLEECQTKLHKEPHNTELAHKEYQANQQMKEANAQYYSWLQQKAKIHWLQVGDSNSKVFYNSLKVRTSRNNINRLMDSQGRWVEDMESITTAFTRFYTTLLQGSNHRTPLVPEIVGMGKTLNDQHRRLLDCNFTDKEIKEAMFSIPSNKAPGLDGYNSHFFKATWNITGGDICQAVRDFFKTGSF
ncbi:hypothetical protein RDABS01_021229 [Bienertia sinuspersici]